MNTINFKEDKKVNLNDISDGNTNFNVAKNTHIDLLLRDMPEDFELNFFVQEDASVNLRIINFNSSKTINIHANVCKNGIFNVILADFAQERTHINSNVILFDDYASSSFRFSTLAKGNDLKLYNISFDHIGEHTSSTLEGFGVAQDEGYINCKGVSHIEKNSIKSNASQLVKVILFDEHSKSTASPTLKIDCDDIKANHGCAIGALNENHMFYLMSRGLSRAEARKLVTTGYLIPITKYFEEELANLILEEINRSL